MLRMTRVRERERERTRTAKTKARECERLRGMIRNAAKCESSSSHFNFICSLNSSMLIYKEWSHFSFHLRHSTRSNVMLYTLNGFSILRSIEIFFRLQIPSVKIYFVDYKNYVCLNHNKIEVFWLSFTGTHVRAVGIMEIDWFSKIPNKIQMTVNTFQITDNNNNINSNILLKLLYTVTMCTACEIKARIDIRLSACEHYASKWIYINRQVTNKIMIIYLFISWLANYRSVFFSSFLFYTRAVILLINMIEFNP